MGTSCGATGAGLSCSGLVSALKEASPYFQWSLFLFPAFSGALITVWSFSYEVPSEIQLQARGQGFIPCGELWFGGVVSMTQLHSPVIVGHCKAGE